MSKRQGTISDQLYRALLPLYPKAFRREYGESLVQLFRDYRRGCSGPTRTLGGVRLWLFILGDLVSSAVAERMSEVLRMPASVQLASTLLKSVVIGVLWGLLNHFVDDLVAVIPGIGPSLASSDLFVPFVLFLWLILALVVVWYSTRREPRIWAAGVVCAAVWTSATISFFLYDLYRLSPGLVAGNVSLGWGWAVVLVLSVLGGFAVGSLTSYLRSRSLSAFP